MSSYFWFLLLLTVTAATSDCPQDCICSPIHNQQTPHHDHATCTTLSNVKGNFPKIHSLDLSSSNLDTIPVELSLPQNVTHLDLSKNHLTKLTKLNSRIRSLDLSHNRLTSSEIVKIVPKIRILNLSYNQITHLPLDVMQFKSMKSINLIGNRIDCSCETLIGMQHDIPEDTNGVMDIGSGEGSGTTDPDIDIEAIENVSPEDYEDDLEDGSGRSGSGMALLPIDISGGTNEEEHHTTDDSDDGYYEEPVKKPVELNIFEGIHPQPETTLAPVVEPIIEKVKHQDTERVAPIALPPAETAPIEYVNMAEDNEIPKKAEEGNSAYILLAVLGILLVSLIAYVVVKRRKTRRRSYNNNDAENIREIEMLDMKKNSNGKQPDVEIIPLMPKKEEPKIERGMGVNPNREINSNIQPLHATTYPKVDAVPLKQNDVPETTDALPESNNNFSEITLEPSAEIPKPADEIDDNKANEPIQNGHNGHLTDDEVFLPQEPAIKRYSPVYLPETGRVKIKLTETPKPKTPMLVTRSRSNAGAYITTPNLNIRSTSANGQ